MTPINVLGSLYRHTLIMHAASLCFSFLFVLSLGAGVLRAQAADPLAPAYIESALKRSADWQLANPHGNTPVTDWVIAPLYDGLLRLALTTGDERYLAAVIQKGRQAGWKTHIRTYHADDIAVSHAWLDIYLMDSSRLERLSPTRTHLDAILAAPRTEELSLREPNRFPKVHATDRWTWCDALYMGPPTFARLYAATGDKRYLEFMDSEFRFTYDRLWDSAEGLFFRDASFIDRKTPNGSKTFWSRGNGWVFGGLGLVLEVLPKDHATRPFYEKLFKEMAVAVLRTQQPDGLWTPSLLDPGQIPVGETSGSAFFVFGLVWGVNHGLLSKEQAWPAIERGWKGLLTRIGADGTVGYVQRIGSAPDSVTASSRQDYGTGAFLLAGSELLRALGVDRKPADLKAFVTQAEARSQLREPRAYARFVPERKDDLAWENDKVAFRVYGPALRDSIEDSGIDAWCKRTAVPVIDRWYAQDLAGIQSYHQDHGEGYDVYKVANSLGCGGLGLWHEGRLLTADVYRNARIFDTTPDRASFHLMYRYTLPDGTWIDESRTITLRLGERCFEVRSRFFHGTLHSLEHGGAKPITGLDVAAGLYSQSPGTEYVLDKASGVVAVWDEVDGEKLGTGIAVQPARVVDLLRAPFGEGHEHALVLMRTDERGEVRYRAGYAWSKAGELRTLPEWTAYLKARTAE